MGRFPSKPSLSPVEDGKWKLETLFSYITSDGMIISVPTGFLTDLASIPAILHPILPVNGKHRLAAIIHDYLYCTQPVSRSKCDSIFLEAMETSGVNWLQRTSMYLGVRTGGWIPFNNYTAEMKRNPSGFLTSCGL